MRRIHLIQPGLRVSRDFIDYPYHCDLAVVQAAAVLRDAGFEPVVHDAFAEPSSGLHPLADGYVLLGAYTDHFLDTVVDPELLVVHYTPFHRPPAKDPILADYLGILRARYPEVPLVLADLYQSGQHYVEAKADQVLRAYPQADVFFKYEAEGRLVEVCERLLADGRPERPLWLEGGEHDDLDGLPLPAWDLVDLDRRDAFLARVVEDLGRAGWAFPVDGRTLPAITSRGCPYRCGHCSSNPGRGARPKTQRRLTPERLVELVDTLVTAHGATRIDVLDEMVNVEPAHFDALQDALHRHEVQYDFPNGMRADHVEPRHIARMAGRVATLSVSAESGSQRVVEQVVGKRLDLSAIDRTVAAAAAAEIPTLVHFIIGMPGETKREINETLEYAMRLHEEHGAWPAVQFATPLPGTRLERTSREAAGGELPVVGDFGPLFQHEPVTYSEDFTSEELRQFKWTFDQRLSAGHEPHKVIMNVTYRCNNHCTFCAVGTRTMLDGNFERQKEILASYRDRGLTMVDFDGGEPTLYEQLVPLIEYARDIGYDRINVTTNGRLCWYPDFAERLTNSGLTTLLFSVHGHDAKTHAANVGVAEAFEQTTDGIKNAVRLKPDGVELGMNVTVTKSNYLHLPAMAELAWSLGLKWMNIQFLTPFGRATVFVNPDTRAAAEVAMKVMDTWRPRGMKFQVINLPFCFMPGYEEVMLGDLMKIQRHMVFVNNADVNLYEYLKEQRGYAEECHTCPHKVFCGGFYELKDVPEPPWMFTEDERDAPLVSLGRT